MNEATQTPEQTKALADAGHAPTADQHLTKEQRKAAYDAKKAAAERAGQVFTEAPPV